MKANLLVPLSVHASTTITVERMTVLSADLVRFISFDPFLRSPLS